jgi:exonuclease SbcD
MRILHTSDWHLNDRLDRIPRQPDIVARLEEIARYLDERKVDVMAVSGDLFSTFDRVDEAQEAIEDVNRIFKPFLLGGGTIVAIAGNHDSEGLFNLLRAALDLASPLDPRQTGPRPRGRLYLASRPTYLLLEDRQGCSVQFALMPYPMLSRYQPMVEKPPSSLEERNRLLHAEMIKKIAQFQSELIDPRLPSVLVCHAHIRGSQLHNLYKITDAEDVTFYASDIPMNWAYGAFGHIHMPQPMGGTSHIRYAGSIERFKVDETESKSVVLVEVGPEGRRGEPEVLPLDATPIHQIEINDPEKDLPRLRDKYPDAARAIVHYKLTYKPGRHNREEVCREIEAIFPRWCKRKIIVEGSPSNGAIEMSESQKRDVPATVRNYLIRQLADDAHRDYRDDVMALAEKLLAETEAQR